MCTHIWFTRNHKECVFLCATMAVQRCCICRACIVHSAEGCQPTRSLFLSILLFVELFKLWITFQLFLFSHFFTFFFLLLPFSYPFSKMFPQCTRNNSKTTDSSKMMKNKTPICSLARSFFILASFLPLYRFCDRAIFDQALNTAPSKLEKKKRKVFFLRVSSLVE